MQEGGGAAVGGTRRARAWLLLCAVLVLAADQGTKALVVATVGRGEYIPVAGDIVGIVNRGNPGGAFGLLPGAPLFFFAATTLIVVGGLVWGWRHPEVAVPVGMVVGGGLGNLADRLFRGPSFFDGHVVDFLYLSFWPTFNVADAAIVVGVGLLFVRSSVHERRAARAEAVQAAGEG